MGPRLEVERMTEPALLKRLRDDLMTCEYYQNSAAPFQQQKALVKEARAIAAELYHRGTQLRLV